MELRTLPQIIGLDDVMAVERATALSERSSRTIRMTSNRTTGTSNFQVAAVGCRPTNAGTSSRDGPLVGDTTDLLAGPKVAD